jgi:hypothetical protein
MSKPKSTFFDRIKQPLIDFLKGSAVKYALKKLLGTAAMGGFKGWLVRYIVTELFEEIAEPVIRYLIRKGALAYDQAEGKIKIIKLERAKASKNEADYDSTIDDI